MLRVRTKFVGAQRIRGHWNAGFILPVVINRDQIPRTPTHLQNVRIKHGPIERRSKEHRLGIGAERDADRGEVEAGGTADA